MQVLIGIFAFAVLIMTIMIVVRLLGNRGRRFDDEVTGRESKDAEGDFLFIFTPALLFLARRGVFSGTHKVYHTIVYGGKDAARALVSWMRHRAARAAEDIARKLDERRHTPRQGGAVSFYLKDIAEHKKKVAASPTEATYEIYEGE